MQKRKEIKVTQGKERYIPQKKKKKSTQKRLGYLEDSRLGSKVLMTQEYTFSPVGTTMQLLSFRGTAFTPS